MHSFSVQVVKNTRSLFFSSPYEHSLHIASLDSIAHQHYSEKRWTIIFWLFLKKKATSSSHLIFNTWRKYNHLRELKQSSTANKKGWYELWVLRIHLLSSCTRRRLILLWHNKFHWWNHFTLCLMGHSGTEGKIRRMENFLTAISLLWMQCHIILTTYYCTVQTSLLRASQIL